MKLLTTQQAADLLGINLNNISLRCRQGKYLEQFRWEGGGSSRRNH